MEHIFAFSWSMAAGNFYHFIPKSNSSNWTVCTTTCYTLHGHTCCGSLTAVHVSSLTCLNNTTASHTKLSGTVSKETFSTLLWTGLPARRQVGNWVASSVSVSLQDLHINDKPFNSELELHELQMLAFNDCPSVHLPLHPLVQGVDSNENQIHTVRMVNKHKMHFKIGFLMFWFSQNN